MGWLRPTPLRWLRPGCPVFAAVLASVTALGAEAEERAFLRFRASGPCVGRDAFVAQVAARTPKARWATRPEGLRVFEVEIAAEPEGSERWSQAAGTLTIRDTDGTVATRRVEGDSCEEVMAAMALVTALAIDPQAIVDAVTVPAPPAAPPEPPQSPPTATPSPPPTPPTSPAPAPPPAWQPPPWSGPPVAEPRAGGPWRWSSGVTPLAASGLGSSMSFVMPAYLDLAAPRHGWWAPSFRLAISYMPKRVIEHEASDAEFIRVAAHPSGCPLRIELHHDVDLRPCVGAEVGMLRGSGAASSAEAEAALWLSVVVPARLQWLPLDWLVLEAQGEFGVPLLRPRFYFEPDRTIVTVDPVYGTVGGGLGVRFP